MIFYKETIEKDPYIKLWRREEWLYPFKNLERRYFPLIITVEPSSYCQNDCLYCCRQLMNRPDGKLSIDLMEKIAHEAATHGSAIRHGGFGEPLIHPKIKEIIAISGKHKVLTTIFTNGQPLTEDKMRSFVESGLDEIRFSSAGITPEEHNRIRTPSDYYRDFDEKIKMASRIKTEMRSEKPYLTVYTHVTDYGDPDFQQNLSAYKDHYLEYADKVDIDLTMYSRVKDVDRVKELGLYEQQKIKEVYEPCVTLYLKNIIHWNGDIFACDMPYNHEKSHFLGNLNDSSISIESAYNGEKMASLRKDMCQLPLKHSNYKICKDCFSNTTKWEDKDFWLK